MSSVYTMPMQKQFHLRKLFNWESWLNSSQSYFDSRSVNVNIDRVNYSGGNCLIFDWHLFLLWRTYHKLRNSDFYKTRKYCMLVQTYKISLWLLLQRGLLIRKQIFRFSFFVSNGNIYSDLVEIKFPWQLLDSLDKCFI